MFKKILAIFCFGLMIMGGNSVQAACDYSEQAELNNIAASVRATYEIKTVVVDVDTGKEVSGITDDQINDESQYIYRRKLVVSILNVTDDIYIHLKSDKGMDRIYHYSDMQDGMIEFDGGDFSSIINYQINIFSNKANCKDSQLRTIDLVTPMQNPFADNGECYYIQDYSYCQTYITTPFLKSDKEIRESISNEYINYKKQSEKKIEEEKQKKSVWEKIKNWVIENKNIIIVGICVLIIIGVATTVWIIRKRRSRII